VVGGGRVAVEIARAIGPCTILEHDAQQARTLPLLLTEVRVVIGEASNKDDLRKAGVASGAIVLAVTDSDASNEFVVRFAQSVGARRVIARTDRPAEVDRLRALGADAVVNMALETASAVLLEMYPPDVSMTEMFLQRGSPAVGRPLSSFDLPRGTVLRSVSRRGKVLLPTPELVLESRDTIIMGGSPSGLARARDMLVGPHAGVRPFGVLAVTPRDLEAAESLALEAGLVAGRSGGGLVVAVPWETSDGEFASSVEQAMAEQGLSATVVKGYSLAPGDLVDALSAARGPGVRAEGTQGAPSDEDGSTWILAVPAQSIGKGPGRVSARRVVALPSLIGAPVLIARRGASPRSMMALVDGAEGADRAATMACELALLTGARLTLLVATYEGETEPREQAAFISAYARSIGLNHVEETALEDPNPSSMERRLRGKVDWLVAAAIPRALRGRDVAAFAASGDLSILLV
jgi:Trk K+ transport system NAD-binding subunit